MERRKIPHFLKGRQSRCSRKIIPITVDALLGPQLSPTLCFNLNTNPTQYKRKKPLSLERIINKRPSGHIQTKFDKYAKDEESKFKELLGFL